MKDLYHKNILQYYGQLRKENSFYVYLEYMSGGNIASIIQEYGPLVDETIRLYTQQILSALIYIHSKGIVHKDIKCANILVDRNGTVKLADFGCSKQLELTINSYTNKSNVMTKSLFGSVPWMAPEVV
jgi:mitogen-activated protein kinase kinase kinase